MSAKKPYTPPTENSASVAISATVVVVEALAGEDLLGGVEDLGRG